GRDFVVPELKAVFNFWMMSSWAYSTILILTSLFFWLYLSLAISIVGILKAGSQAQTVISFFAAFSSESDPPAFGEHAVTTNRHTSTAAQSLFMLSSTSPQRIDSAYKLPFSL